MQCISVDGRRKRSAINEFSDENVLVWRRPKAQFKRPTYRLMRKIYVLTHYIRFDTFDATFEPGITNSLIAIILACKRMALFMNW